LKPKWRENVTKAYFLNCLIEKFQLPHYNKRTQKHDYPGLN